MNAPKITTSSIPANAITAGKITIDELAAERLKESLPTQFALDRLLLIHEFYRTRPVRRILWKIGITKFPSRAAEAWADARMKDRKSREHGA